MDKKLTPTLALIIAGGVAAGIGLARPASSGQVATGPAQSAEVVVDEEQPAPAPNSSSGDDGTYRSGNRQGNRGGTPAGAPAGDDGNPTAEDGAGDGNTGGNDDARAQPATIEIRDFTFAGPATVAPGTPLSITNLDGVAHTLTFRTGEGDTGNLDGGGATTLNAPTTPGTYAFFCAIHPSMEGQLTVAD